MAIEYNPNKKDSFYGYINTATSNLRSAENKMADIVNNCEFPSKTAIGRKFAGKPVIRACESCAKSARQDVSTVGTNVRKQVVDFLNADKRAKELANSLTLSLTGAIGKFINKKGEKRGKQTTNLNWAPSYMQGTQANIVNTDGLNWAYSYQGGGAPVGGYKGYSNYTISDFWRDLKKTGATIVNGAYALIGNSTEMIYRVGDKAFELGERLVSYPYYALKDEWTNVTSGGKKKVSNLNNLMNSATENVAKTSYIKKYHNAKYKQPSYKQLDDMSYADLNKFLGDEVLKSPLIKEMKNGLKVRDEKDKANNDPLLLRTPDMYRLIFKKENIFTKDSVCQGGAYVKDKVMIYCDIDSDKSAGQMHVVVNDHSLFWNQDCKIVASVDVESHSNDITYIPKDEIILHPDHNNKKIDVYKLKKGKGEYDYTIEKINELEDKNADAIAYDEVTDKIIAVNGTDADVYSRDDYLAGKKEPETKFKVADQIKDTRDKDDCTYYNYRAGATAYNGVLYIAYNGFEEDKEKYEDEDVQKSNMISLLDYESGGKPIGRIMDNVAQELESIDHNEAGKMITFVNYGQKTRVFISETLNISQVATDYRNEQTMKAKTKKNDKNIKNTNRIDKIKK